MYRENTWMRTGPGDLGQGCRPFVKKKLQPLACHTFHPFQSPCWNLSLHFWLLRLNSERKAETLAEPLPFPSFLLGPSSFQAAPLVLLIHSAVAWLSLPASAPPIPGAPWLLASGSPARLRSCQDSSIAPRHLGTCSILWQGPCCSELWLGMVLCILHNAHFATLVKAIFMTVSKSYKSKSNKNASYITLEDNGHKPVCHKRSCWGRRRQGGCQGSCRRCNAPNVSMISTSTWLGTFGLKSSISLSPILHQMHIFLPNTKYKIGISSQTRKASGTSNTS